ncbi:MAG: DUF6616 family protein [Planctomycetota bacterium]|jgi:hypothetical protein
MSAPYILTEIWKPRDSWLALSSGERERFFDERIGPLLGHLIEKGAEILGCAINDNTGSERLDYRYMAIWKLPSKSFSEEIEAAAKQAGFLEYFEQVNFSGSMIAPEQLNGDMIGI